MTAPLSRPPTKTETVPDVLENPEAFGKFPDRLERLFTGMDAAWNDVAAKTGFVCNGCGRNCCESLFFHHTLAEFFYLREGFLALPPGARERAVKAAAEAVRETEFQMASGLEARIMCPVNEGGRCLVYAHRPMICRMHGLPHELVRPDGGMLQGPGCHEFTECCGGKEVRFDRTPFYREMAALEREIRDTAGYTKRIKLTVAEMILRFHGNGNGGRP